MDGGERIAPWGLRRTCSREVPVAYPWGGAIGMGRLALTQEAQHSEPRWRQTIDHRDGLNVGLRFAQPAH